MPRYVVSRLCENGLPVSRVVLNKTPDGDEKEGRKYGRYIERHSYKGAFWKYVGQIVSDVDNLDYITREYGAEDTVILKRTGVDVTGMSF